MQAEDHVHVREQERAHRMLKHGRAMSIIAATAIALGAAACGGSSSSSSSSSSSAESGAAATTAAGAGSSSSGGATVAVKNKKVALILASPKNDGSFGQANYEGAKKAADETGAQLRVVENVISPSDFTTQATSLARAGYTFIAIANGGVASAIPKMASQFPQTTFCEIAVIIKDMPKNVCTYSINFQDGTFIGGALAGWLTKTNKVGAISGFPIPTVFAESEGFLLGARWANPKVTVLPHVVLNTGTDVQKARSAAQALISQGADLIFSAADSSTVGMIKAAEAKPGTYVVAQYIDTHQLGPKVVLTTVVNGLADAAYKIELAGITGQVTNKDYEYPPPESGGILTPFYDLDSVVPADVKAKVAEVQKQIADGKIQVPYLPNVNSAAKYDLSKLPAPPK